LQGRLPIGNKSIDDALEVGLTQCLKQLQTTNPNLLLTTAELRKAECDARYVPAVSLAVATILSNSKIVADNATIEQIHSWDESSEMRSQMLPPNISTCSNRFAIRSVQTLSSSIERRLRLILTKSMTIASTTRIPVTSSNVDEKENKRNNHASASSPDSDTLQLCHDGDKLARANDQDTVDNQFDIWM
jgi:hypothetical protein